MNLALKRPLLFFDLESTGVEKQKDKIVQLAIKKINLDGSIDNHEFLVNPERPIPPSATAIHGITDNDVAGKPTFKMLAAQIRSICEFSDLAGFNSNQFDVPMLLAEFDRTEVLFLDWEYNLLDVRLLQMKIRPQGLNDIHKEYFGTDIQGAHNASSDTEATFNVFVEQMNQYEKKLIELTGIEVNQHLSIEDLDLLCQGEKRRFDVSGVMYLKNGVPYWSLPKHKDEAFDKKIHGSYLNWILNSDFPNETKRKLRSLMETKKDENQQLDLI